MIEKRLVHERGDALRRLRGVAIFPRFGEEAPVDCVLCNWPVEARRTGYAVLDSKGYEHGRVCGRCAAEYAPFMVRAGQLRDELYQWRRDWPNLGWEKAGKKLESIGRRLWALVVEHPELAEAPKPKAGRGKARNGRHGDEDDVR